MAVTSKVVTPAPPSATHRGRRVDRRRPAAQPCPTARPSRTSMATAIALGTVIARRAPRRSAGSRQRGRPDDDSRGPGVEDRRDGRARCAARRRPPPRRGPRPRRRCAAIDAVCTGAPVRAPSRSTTWSHGRRRRRTTARPRPGRPRTRSRARSRPARDGRRARRRRSIAGRTSKPLARSVLIVIAC